MSGCFATQLSPVPQSCHPENPSRFPATGRKLTSAPLIAGRNLWSVDAPETACCIPAAAPAAADRRRGFQLAQSIASLYLPTLNADIIDEGVAKATRASS